MICIYCQAEKTCTNDICTDCQDLITEQNNNLKLGLCPKCNGSCVELNGTTCTECKGLGIEKERAEYERLDTLQGRLWCVAP